MARPLVVVWREAVRDSELHRLVKLVAFVLSTHMDAHGAAYPSRETIRRGGTLGQSRRSVDNALRQLEQDGFLIVTRSRGRTSNRYQALLPTARAATPLTDAQRHAERRPTARAATPEQEEVGGAASAPYFLNEEDGDAGCAAGAPPPPSEVAPAASSAEVARSALSALNRLDGNVVDAGPGACDDCGASVSRARLGRFALCASCLARRLRALDAAGGTRRASS